MAHFKPDIDAVMVLLLVIMLVFLINSFTKSITGAVVLNTEKCDIKCVSSESCNDNNNCTIDLCILKERCDYACDNVRIDDC